MRTWEWRLALRPQVVGAHLRWNVLEVRTGPQARGLCEDPSVPTLASRFECLPVSRRTRRCRAGCVCDSNLPCPLRIFLRQGSSPGIRSRLGRRRTSRGCPLPLRIPHAAALNPLLTAHTSQPRAESQGRESDSHAQSNPRRRGPHRTPDLAGYQARRDACSANIARPSQLQRARACLCVRRRTFLAA